MELEKKIAIAITESLPEKVGEELKARLELIPKLKQDYEQLKIAYDALIEVNKTIKEEVKKLTYLKGLETSLLEFNESEKIRKIKEDSLKEINDIKVSAANSKVDLMNNFVGLLVKNPQAVTSMFTNYTNTPYYRPDGITDFETTQTNSTVITTQEK